MNEKIASILAQAAELTAEEHADLIDALMDGHEENDGYATPEIQKAWEEEIERRIAAFDRGETVAIDAYKVNLRRLVE